MRAQSQAWTEHLSQKAREQAESAKKDRRAHWEALVSRPGHFDKNFELKFGLDEFLFYGF